MVNSRRLNLLRLRRHSQQKKTTLQARNPNPSKLKNRPQMKQKKTQFPMNLLTNQQNRNQETVQSVEHPMLMTLRHASPATTPLSELER